MRRKLSLCMSSWVMHAREIGVDEELDVALAARALRELKLKLKLELVAFRGVAKVAD